VFAVWLDTLAALVAQNANLLKGKVAVDPTNPIKLDGNRVLVRSLPEDQTSGPMVAGLLPPDAHYVKAFGSLGAPSLVASANRSPRRAVLFYATDDAQAVGTVERLISAAGFDPVQVGGLKDVARIEMPGGDIHQGGGLKGTLLDADQARAADDRPQPPAGGGGNRRRQRREQQGDAPGAFVSSRRSRGRLVAVRQQRRAHRARRDAAVAVAGQRARTRIRGRT
jgi:8-hydroxy-5-deazaflavin:NADPH oxidoreductase